MASRNAKSVIDEDRGVGPLNNGVFLDFADSIKRFGRDAIEDRYGNLFEMYERITGENPYERPMRIYPAPHYTMGGLLGGLQPDEQHRRTLRVGRGELL